MSHITIQIDELADYIFLRNEKNQLIYLDIHGLKDCKDLFCLCLDLLCKGIVLLYGDGQRAFVDDVTMEQFHYLIQRLKYAGIECNMEVYTTDMIQLMNKEETTEMKETPESNDIPNAHDVILHSVKNINTLPDHLQLNQYKFMLRVNSVFYLIHFDLLRML